MTEKEKAALGLLYQANFDKTLNEERKKAKLLCQKFNTTLYNEMRKKKAIIRELCQTKTNFFHLEPSFWCDYGYNISFGDLFYANHNLTILDAAKVTFGDSVFIGPNCGFYTSGHPLDAPQRNEGLEYAKPINIGNNVWIGGNVVVLPGVTIGDHSVIGAGSIVTKDIPPHVLAFGNPCQVIKEIPQS